MTATITRPADTPPCQHAALDALHAGIIALAYQAGRDDERAEQQSSRPAPRRPRRERPSYLSVVAG